jgi:hypothetical protein
LVAESIGGGGQIDFQRRWNDVTTTGMQISEFVGGGGRLCGCGLADSALGPIKCKTINKRLLVSYFYSYQY